MFHGMHMKKWRVILSLMGTWTSGENNFFYLIVRTQWVFKVYLRSCLQTLESHCFLTIKILMWGAWLQKGLTSFLKSVLFCNSQLWESVLHAGFKVSNVANWSWLVYNQTFFLPTVHLSSWQRSWVCMLSWDQDLTFVLSGTLGDYQGKIDRKCTSLEQTWLIVTLQGSTG